MSHIVSQEQAHNHDFLHLCKMMISPGFFLLFQNFDFSGQGGGRVAKGQMVQNDKNFCPASSHLRNHTSYDCYLWHTCVN